MVSGDDMRAPAQVLVAYATIYGSTREVAESIGSTLRETGVATDVSPAADVRDLSGYAAVILGAPLANHRLHKDAHKFLSSHRDALARMRVALFALGPVHEDPKEWEESRSQLDQELAKLAWFRPVAAELFGGRFDPALLRFPLNKLAASAGASDVRDWDAIHDWAVRVSGLLLGG